ncbi:site-specific integrase [Neomoorella thermoacetica]|uniref:site-specific integrase n=1 Tax=Neomoorella thermoacetica TaxID=1525 RepID=UPI0009BAC333
MKSRRKKYGLKKKLNTFLQSAKEYRYFPVFWLALYTGMRIGEILALRWTDVDLSKKIIYVRRTVSGTGYQPPKNKRKRHLPIDQDTADLLKKHRKRHMEECLRFGRNGRQTYWFL